MNVDWLRKLCLSFHGTTEQIQWGNDLLFKVAGKMFAVTPLEPARVFLSFKASPENFAEVTERANIIPAPYLARAQWAALETKEALASDELTALLRESYDLALARLPKKVRESIAKKFAGNSATVKRSVKAKTKRMTGRDRRSAK